MAALATMWYCKGVCVCVRVCVYVCDVCEYARVCVISYHYTGKLSLAPMRSRYVY